METLVAKNKYSIEEYLFMEDRSLEKHEFYNGRVVNIPGAKPAHNLIATNFTTQLSNELEKNRKLILYSTAIQKFGYPG